MSTYKYEVSVELAEQVKALVEAFIAAPEDVREVILAFSTTAKPDEPATLRAVVVRPKTFDPKGGFACTVDPDCKWTGKTLKRAGVHAKDLNDLKAQGHLPVHEA